MADNDRMGCLWKGKDGKDYFTGSIEGPLNLNDEEPDRLKLSNEPSAEECPSEIMERLAEIEHERWIGQAETALNEMTPERRERWGRLSKIKYADLDEHNKELDRMRVRKYWPTIAEWLEADRAAQRQAGREEAEAYITELECEVGEYHEIRAKEAARYAALVEAARYALLEWEDLCTCDGCEVKQEILRKALRELDGRKE